MFFTFAAGSLLLFGILFHSTEARAQSTNAASVGGDARFVEGEILIQFKPGATDELVADVLRRAAVASVKHILTPAMKHRGNIGITRVETRMPAVQALQALQNHPAIEMAQPNWIYTHQAVPNDQYYVNGSLWGMYGDGSTPMNAFGSQAAEAWAAGNVGSETVCVGIIDEGIQYNHPDLAANMWVNQEEYEGTTGVDDDGNGYADDIYGWNAINDNGVIYDSRWDDHGTHVAGTIGAVGGNGIGVVGVNWNVKLIAGKFLGPRSGTTADAIQAIDYMTNLKEKKGVNIVALNNSWGGGGYDNLLLAAIQRAAAQDILFVAAAGNSGVNTDISPSYPACYDDPSVVSVAAIDSSGSLASFSNYGATTVDLGAPGVNIVSTLPGGQYGAYNGTSMATPHVTGAAALYAAMNPSATMTMLDIKSAILSSAAAEPTTSLQGKTTTGGRLNVSGFTAAATVPPNAPFGLSASVDSRTVNMIHLSWTDNSDNETLFIIRRIGGNTIPDITVAANVTSYVDAWLDQNTTYTYSIAAHNSAGDSWAMDPASASATTGPFPAPATAQYIATDTYTSGNWCDVYGASGYGHLPYAIDPEYPDETLVKPDYYALLLPEYGYPDGVAIESFGKTIYNWTTSTADTRALVKVCDQDPIARWLGCYYSGSDFTLDLDTGGEGYQVAFYVVDWDKRARSQNIEIFDYYRQTSIAGTLRSVTDFINGKYLIYNLKGRVLIQFTRTGNENAVLSGIFFDAPVDSKPTVSITSPANESTVRGTAVSLTASASDDVGVTQVEFLVDGAWVNEDKDDTDGWSATWDLTGVSDGAHTITAIATDSAGQTTTSAGVTVTVDNFVDPTVHCGDLDGSKTLSSRNWTATVTVTIHNADHQPVSGATVTGIWSGGYSHTASGTTGTDGTVSFPTGAMKLAKTSVTFTLTGVTATGMTYSPSYNHDPDGDSNGTFITITK